MTDVRAIETPRRTRLVLRLARILGVRVVPGEAADTLLDMARRLSDERTALKQRVRAAGLGEEEQRP